MREFDYKPPEPGSSPKGRKGGGGGGDNSPLITPATTPTGNVTAVTPKVIQIDPVSTETGGYSAVNVLSILPDEMRTEENLEGGSLPPDQAHQLLTQYHEQRKQYEERELKKMAASITTTSAAAAPPTSSLQPQPSAVKTLSFSPGYEDVEPQSPGYDNVMPISKSAQASQNGNPSVTNVGGGVGGEYEDPADAVANEIGVRHLRGSPKGRAVVAPKSQISPEKPRKFQFSSSVNDKYTDVYNPGDGEMVGQSGLSKRALSDSSANRLVNGRHSPGKLAHHYQNTIGTGGGEEGGHSSGSSLDDMSKVMDRTEPIRSSKHKSAKEEVEFDPTSRKVFRVTSTKKKRSPNGRDLPDGGESNGDSSPDAKIKEKQFNLSDELSGEEYSMVNVADKQKYRTEDDTMKKEGSGIPQRYSAKLPQKAEEVA